MVLRKECTTVPDVTLFKDNMALVSFALKHALYISYKILGFTHGDIKHGNDNNVLYKIVDAPGVTHVVYRIIEDFGEGEEEIYYIFKLSVPGKIPTVVMFDYGYSDLAMRDYTIVNRIPLASDQQPITDNTEEPQELVFGSNLHKIIKRNLDLEGVNIILNRLYGSAYSAIPYENAFGYNNGVTYNVYDNLSQNNHLMNPSCNGGYEATIVRDKPANNSHLSFQDESTNRAFLTYGFQSKEKVQKLYDSRIPLPEYSTQ